MVIRDAFTGGITRLIVCFFFLDSVESVLGGSHNPLVVGSSPIRVRVQDNNTLMGELDKG